MVRGMSDVVTSAADDLAHITAVVTVKSCRGTVHICNCTVADIPVSAACRKPKKQSQHVAFIESHQMSNIR